jgi:hypothetical protein
VWEGSGTTADNVVDYISTGYLDKHLGPQQEHNDWRIVCGMVTKTLYIDNDNALPSKLTPTTLFQQLQVLIYWYRSDIYVLPYLEQIKELAIGGCSIPAYSLDINLPLVHTLQKLVLKWS